MVMIVPARYVPGSHLAESLMHYDPSCIMIEFRKITLTHMLASVTAMCHSHTRQRALWHLQRMDFSGS